jgi:hypothetical protein
MNHSRNVHAKAKNVTWSFEDIEISVVARAGNDYVHCFIYLDI